MRRLQIDDRWGQTCVGYHVQARPNRDSIDKLQFLQQGLMQISPVALNLIPADALHLSVSTLLPAQSFSNRVETEWSQIQKDVNGILAALPDRGELRINFQKLTFTKTAITVVTRVQPIALLEARCRFDNLLAAAGMKRPLYNQAHITIARYAENATLLSADLSSVERDDLAVDVTFQPYQIVRERRYPSLQIESV